MTAEHSHLFPAPVEPEWSCEDDDYDPDDPGCQTCGGDGFEECEDSNSSEGCWERRCNGRLHECPNCGGSGLARDQRFW